MARLSHCQQGAEFFVRPGSRSAVPELCRGITVWSVLLSSLAGSAAAGLALQRLLLLRNRCCC